MTNVSDFDKPDAWRESTLTCIRGSSLCHRGQVTCSYVEMLGLSGYVMFERMRGMLTSPQQFIGVEEDPAILYTARRDAERRGHGFQIALGDFYSYCVRSAEAAFTDPLPPAAIFNADETHQTSNEGWWQNRSGTIVQALEKAVAHYGDAIFVLNCSLDRSPRGQTSADQLVELARSVGTYFGKWKFDRTSLLGRDCVYAARVDDQAFGRNEPAWAGAFQIYGSGNRKLRMATLRLRFDRTRVTAYKEARR